MGNEWWLGKHHQNRGYHLDQLWLPASGTYHVLQVLKFILRNMCQNFSKLEIGHGWERFTSWYKIVFIKEWTSHWLCTNLHCTRLGDLVASPWALWESFLMPFQQFCSWLLSMFLKDWNDICIVVEWRVIYRGREHEKLWIDIWW